MLYILRMFLAVFFGVISVFALAFAVDFHGEVNVAYRRLCERSELKKMNVGLGVETQNPDEYYNSMTHEIGFRYGIAGIFIACTVASMCLGGQPRLTESSEGRVFGPEDK